MTNAAMSDEYPNDPAGKSARIERRSTTELSLRDMERYIEIIESDAEPNKNLKAAAAKHRKLVRSDV